jgi:hypothetical protein
MRVLLVTDWASARGGVEAYTTWLRAGLEAAGDEVRLLTSTIGSAGDGLAEFHAWGTEQMRGWKSLVPRSGRRPGLRIQVEYGMDE